MKKKTIDIEEDPIEELSEKEIEVLEEKGLVKRDKNGKLIFSQELKVKCR